LALLGSWRTILGLFGDFTLLAQALFVVGANFGAEVLTFVIVCALIMLVLLMPLAGELGKRAQGKGEPAEAPAA